MIYFSKDNWFDSSGSFKFGKAIVHTFAAFILLGIVWGSWGTVDATERGIKTRFDEIVGTVQPGLYFKLPFIESVYKLNFKVLTTNYDRGADEGDVKQIDTNLFGASKDLQEVTIGVVVNYQVNPLVAEKIYREFKSVENYQTSVLEPLIRETVKSTSALYTAEELVTKRAEYSEKVDTLLTNSFLDRDTVLKKFSVTNFEFSNDFTKAIEAKVKAEQDALAAKNTLEKVKFEAEQRIAQAKGEAEAIKIQAQAITQQGGADYVKLQWIKAWQEGGAKVPTFITSDKGGAFMMNINP